MTSDTEILAAVARALNGSLDVDDALEAVLTTVADYLELETGWVWVAEGDEQFRLGAARHLPEGLRGDPQWTSGSCWCHSRFCNGGLVGGDVELITCSRLEALSDGTDGLRYHASLALQAGGERLGIMNIASRDWRQLDARELEVLRAVSDMLAVALGRARLYERSREIGAHEERTRLSREIHDGVAQSLTALVLRLEALRTKAPEVETDIDRALEIARASLRETRTAVLGLRKSPFAEGLQNGLSLVVRQARMHTDLDVTVDLDVGDEPPPRVAHAACRIVQEALSNVTRHSGSGTCEVRATGHGESLVVSVSDGGVGFDPATDAGVGLLGMRERARLAGGTLDVQSAADGTAITFSWGVS